MPRKTKPVTFDTVREIARALPGAQESTAYGSPALRVHGKMFACMAVHRSAEPDSLAVTAGFEQRDALLAEDPNTYYITPHYVDYPTVLVRLDRVTADVLKDLLIGAHRFATSSSKRPRRKPKRG